VITICESDGKGTFMFSSLGTSEYGTVEELVMAATTLGASAEMVKVNSD
jgi:hypothetical protein